MAQMTAVEWFMSQIIDGEIDPATNAIFLKRLINKVEVLEKAKQMEKDKIIEFAEQYNFYLLKCKRGVRGSVVEMDAEQYYNETYKTQAQ